MTLRIVSLSILVALSATLTIVAWYLNNKRLEYIFKPLATSGIILIALLNDDPFSTRYQVLIVLGLVASLGGDIALMLPNPKYFLYGLVSFLIAHLFYIAAFTVEGGRAPFWYIIPFALYGVFILAVLWSHLDTFKRPVLVYVGVILIMAWQATNRWIDGQLDGSLLAMIGAYLFVMSDSALAIDRFRGAFPHARLCVLSTYFTAQWLIALSI